MKPPQNLLFLTFLVGLISFTSLASADLGTFKQGECVEIKTVLNTASVTLSGISYPNSTIAVSNQPMIQNGLSFTYSFCDTNTSGTYNYDYYDAEGNTFVNEFQINPIGIESTQGRTDALSRAIWIVFGIAILLFVSFMFIVHPSAKYISLIFCFIFILVGINLVSATLNQEVVAPAIIELFNFITAASFYFYWLAGGLICVILILTTFATIWEKYKDVKLGKYGGNENIGSKKY